MLTFECGQTESRKQRVNEVLNGGQQVFRPHGTAPEGHCCLLHEVGHAQADGIGGHVYGITNPLRLQWRGGCRGTFH